MSSYARIYGADFETDTDGVKAWICQWAVVGPDGDKEVSDGYYERHGRTHKEICALFTSLIASSNPRRRTKVYFHNLNFDIQFLRGFLHDLSKIYDCRWIMRNNRAIVLKIGKYFEFRDSAAKMPDSLKAMGKSIGVPKLTPPDENFSWGWSFGITDDPEYWKYVIRDATIPAVAMRQMHEKGMTKATIAGDAWQHLQKSYAIAHGLSGENPKWNKEYFLNHFTPLPHDLDAKIRKAYFGGINISEHRGFTSGDLTHEDVHSMYPTVMCYDPLPYGPAYRLDKIDEEKYPLWIISADIRLNLKDGMIPWFKFRSKADADLEEMKAGEPVRYCEFYHHLTLSSIDIDLLQKFYRVEIDESQSISLWGFKAEIGALRPYIEHWYSEKSTYEKGTLDYVVAKLMMNSAYGRFAMRSEGEEMSLAWDDDISDYTFQRVGFEESEPETYLPYGIFVTAHARRRLLENVLIAPEKVIHCDTDSVVHMGPPSPLGHDAKLGDWDIESRPICIYEGGFKRYIEFYREPACLKDISMACAGVPQKTDDLTGIPIGMWVELLDNPELIARDGYELGRPDYAIKSAWLRALYIKAGKNPDCVDTRKLLPKKVCGGAILIPTTYKLNDNLIWRLR